MSSIADTKTDKPRSAYWDNIKGLLIALVVFAHCIYAFTGKPVNRYIVGCIYFFHMPAFVFVSGFFSKSKNASGAASLVRLLAAYVLLTAVHTVMALAAGKSPHIITPYYSAWYLLAIIVWRLVTPYFAKIKWIIPIFIAVSLLAGFWPAIDNRFALARLIGFYPFFLAGYFLSAESSEKLINTGYLKKLLIAAAALAAAAVIAFFSVRKLGVGLGDLLFKAYGDGIAKHFVGRIAVFAAASLCIAAILLLSVKFRIPILTKAGRNSLAIYLIHRPLTLILNRFLAPLSAPMQLAAAAVFTVLSLLLLGSDFVSGILDRILSFFTDAFMLSDGGSKRKRIIGRIVACLLVFALLAAPLARYAINFFLK